MHHWLPVLAAAQHNGEALKSFLQGWIGPLFLAFVGGTALTLLFGERRASALLSLGAIAVGVAMYIYSPETLKNLGVFLGGLF